MNTKKMIKWGTTMLCSFVMLSLTACGSDDDNSTSVEKRVTLSRKTGYGNDWIYFSLSQGKEVSVKEENHATDLTWDLAFNRYNIRTNSGKSGSGKGGAYDTGKTNLAEVVAVTSNDFTVDEDGEITDSFTGEGITTVASTLNKVLANAIAFSGPPPTYKPNNHVYIVKTADGKFAKLQVEGFYNDEGVSGFVTFKYVYQPDGSTNLKTN